MGKVLDRINTIYRMGGVQAKEGIGDARTAGLTDGTGGFDRVHGRKM